MISPIKYAVYLRKMPVALATLITRDGAMGLAKDGVQNGLGHACPRITVTVYPLRPDRDKERLRRLEELLTELTQTNQIAGFS